MAGDVAQPLGGTSSGAVRIGCAVRRNAGPWSPTVHLLLEHLRGSGIAVPDVLGMDGEGHELLAWVEGRACWKEHRELWGSAARLEGAARLLRRLHEALDTFAPPPDATWRTGWGRGVPGVDPVCHNDFAPWNVVVTPAGELVTIDWDGAGPADRLHELAYAASAFVPIRSSAECARLGWLRPPNRTRRIELFWQAYGLPDSERPAFARALVENAEDSMRFGRQMHREGREPFASHWAADAGASYRDNLHTARRVAGRWLRSYGGSRESGEPADSS